MNETQLVTILNSTQGLPDSVRFLLRNRKALAEYQDIVALVLDAEQGLTPAKGLAFHLKNIRNEVYTVLWGHQFLIGMSILEEILFQVFSDSAVANPLAELERILFAIHDLGHGLVVFPLHAVSFPTTAFATTPEVTCLNLDTFGFRIYPAANDYDKAVRNIEDTAKALGITNPIPRQSFAHWRQVRRIPWLAKNPLLITRAHHSPGNYYENQSGLLNLALFATSLTYGLAALYTRNPDDDLFSTRLVNSWSTLNFRHYIAMYPTADATPLTGECIPLKLDDPAILEVTELNAFLPADYSASVDMNVLTRLEGAMSIHRQALFSSRIARRNKKKSAQHHLARKLLVSLQHFRKSHVRSSYSDERALALATAFEVLLTDRYAPGVGTLLTRRAEEALLAEGVSDPESRGAAVGELYTTRCEVVHGGAAVGDDDVDFQERRRDYVRCYSAIASGLNQLPEECPNPVEFILKSQLKKMRPHPFSSRLKAFFVGVALDIRRRYRISRNRFD